MCPTAMQSLRGMVIECPMQPQEFCAIWVKRIHKIEQGQHGYRSAAKSALQETLAISDRDADRLLTKPADLNKSRALLKCIALQQQHVINLMKSLKLRLPEIPEMTPAEYCQEWLLPFYGVSNDEWGAGKYRLRELEKVGLCPNTVKSWGREMNCGDRTILKLLGRQHFINQVDQSPHVVVLIKHIRRLDEQVRQTREFEVAA